MLVNVRAKGDFRRAIECRVARHVAAEGDVLNKLTTLLIIRI